MGDPWRWQNGDKLFGFGGDLVIFRNNTLYSCSNVAKCGDTIGHCDERLSFTGKIDSVCRLEQSLLLKVEKKKKPNTNLPTGHKLFVVNASYARKEEKKVTDFLGDNTPVTEFDNLCTYSRTNEGESSIIAFTKKDGENNTHVYYIELDNRLEMKGDEGNSGFKIYGEVDFLAVSPKYFVYKLKEGNLFMATIIDSRRGKYMRRQITLEPPQYSVFFHFLDEYRAVYVCDRIVSHIDLSQSLISATHVIKCEGNKGTWKYLVQPPLLYVINGKDIYGILYEEDHPVVCHREKQKSEKEYKEVVCISDYEMGTFLFGADQSTNSVEKIGLPSLGETAAEKAIDEHVDPVKFMESAFSKKLKQTAYQECFDSLWCGGKNGGKSHYIKALEIASRPYFEKPLDVINKFEPFGSGEDVYKLPNGMEIDCVYTKFLVFLNELRSSEVEKGRPTQDIDVAIITLYIIFGKMDDIKSFLEARADQSDIKKRVIDYVAKTRRDGEDITTMRCVALFYAGIGMIRDAWMKFKTCTEQAEERQIKIAIVKDAVDMFKGGKNDWISDVSNDVTSDSFKWVFEFPSIAINLFLPGYTQTSKKAKIRENWDKVKSQNNIRQFDIRFNHEWLMHDMREKQKPKLGDITNLIQEYGQKLKSADCEAPGRIKEIVTAYAAMPVESSERLKLSDFKIKETKEAASSETTKTTKGMQGQDEEANTGKALSDMIDPSMWKELLWINKEYKDAIEREAEGVKDLQRAEEEIFETCRESDNPNAAFAGYFQTEMQQDMALGQRIGILVKEIDSINLLESLNLIHGEATWHQVKGFLLSATSLVTSRYQRAQLELALLKARREEVRFERAVQRLKDEHDKADQQ